MTLVIRGCSILDNSQPRGYREGVDILISGARIVRVGDLEMDDADQIINGENLIALPGLINSHTHSSENVFRSSTERLPLEIWLVHQFLNRTEFPPSLNYLITMVGGIEMLKLGITSVLDHFWMAEQPSIESISASFRAYADLGMRATLAPMIEDEDFILECLKPVNPHLNGKELTTQQTTEALLELVEEAMDKWHNREDGTLQCIPGPGGPQWCSDQLLEGARQLSYKFGTGLHTHVTETKVQSLICQEVFGQSGVMRLKELGCLTPRTSLAHCIWVDEVDLSMIAETGSIVVHNPVSNMKLGSGVAPIDKMISAGIPVALGTDGAGSNDNQDMWETIKTACLLQSPAVLQNGFWLGAEQAFRMATIGGASVIGKQDELGKIAPQYLADLVLVNLENIYLDPIPNALNYFVYANKPSIQHVFVNGRQVIKDGVVTTVDERVIRKELLQGLKLFHTNNPRSMRKVEAQKSEWRKAIHEYLQ